MGPGPLIDWDSGQSHTLLNPKISNAERKQLEELSGQHQRPGHIWIASSGSSAGSHQSVKLIALSKKAFLASAEAVNRHLMSGESDIWLQAIPRFHVGGLSIEARAYLSGASIRSGVRDEKWDAGYFIDQAEQTKATLSSLVPTQVYDLIQTGRRAPSALRAIVIGGSALSTELYLKATSLGWPLLPSYGLTECCSQVATAELESWKTQTPRLRILSHVKAETTSEGLLRIQSEALLSGYAQWRDGNNTWTDPKVQGWYQTEDICELKDGFLKPFGRGSDYVKVSGEGVSLPQLQETLESLARRSAPDLWLQVAVAALPHPRSGSALVLAHSSKVSATTAAKIQSEFNQIVAPFERLTQNRPVAEIPRTALGKIAREKLKEMLLKI